MNATKRWAVALGLVVLACGGAGDGGDALATDTAEVDASGAVDPCMRFTGDWPDLLASTAAAHASCVTAADCTLLTYDLECPNGAAVGSCGVPVSAAGEADAKAELQAAGALACEQAPPGCVATASCMCVLPICDEGTTLRLACLESQCVISDTVPFDQLAFTPTERPGVAAFDDVAAFVPDWCAGETEGSSPTYGWPTLDCPGLAATWPCSAFLAPLPFTAALTPERPLLRRTVRQPLADDTHPECQCTGGIRSVDWSGLGCGFSGDSSGPCRTCTSLIGLVEGQPQAIDSKGALAQAFAPVETPAEALAFATVTGTGAAERRELAHVFASTDLDRLGPYAADAEHACRAEPLQGTRVEAVEGGFRVITFAPGHDCDVDFLSEVTLFVATTGEVTLEAKRPICWYENFVCVE